MKDKYPMQPIMNGRFESNPIVDWLCTEVSSMNDIAHYCAENDIAYKYQEQLAQLVGYSVGGYGSLSYVSDESYERAETQMNIDNIATQTPEEKEALDAVDFSRACEIGRSKLKSNPIIQLSIDEIDKFSGEVEWNGEGLPPVGVECEVRFRTDGDWTDWFSNGKFKAGYDSKIWFSHEFGDCVYPSHDVEFRKPETQQQREERERLEAAEDIYYTYMSQWEICQRWSVLDQKNKDAFLAIVDKTNYRKESN